MEQIKDWVIQQRRELHKIPELGYKEFKTSAYIQKVLNKLGFKFQTVGTGIVVNIKGTDPKKTIGFRADMDALPIEEQYQSDYKSTHSGVMHACGHDGHMAVLLGWAKYLQMNPPKNNVVLVFQPAEELFGLGAQAMVESGLVRADVFYAIHVQPEYEVGKFDIKKLAGGELFTVEFTGKGRHACNHDGKDDAILAATRFISDLESLNTKDFIFHVGKINGGDAPTAVADKVVINGTMRYFDTNNLKIAHKKISAVIAEIEKQNLGKATITYDEKRYPPTIPTPKLVDQISKLDGCVGVIETFGSEDFSVFIENFTGAIMYIGAKVDGVPLHNSRFTLNEDALLFGIKLFKKLFEMHEK